MLMRQAPTMHQRQRQTIKIELELRCVFYSVRGTLDTSLPTADFLFWCWFWFCVSVHVYLIGVGVWRCC
jgi:hypothetical protein